MVFSSSLSLSILILIVIPLLLLLSSSATTTTTTIICSAFSVTSSVSVSVSSSSSSSSFIFLSSSDDDSSNTAGTTTVSSTSIDDTNRSLLLQQPEEAPVAGLVETRESKFFLDWMFDRRGCQGERNTIQILETTNNNHNQHQHRRGLYVTQDIVAGDYIFAVPFNSSWIIEKGDSNHANDELSDAERGDRFLLWQKMQTQRRRKNNGLFRTTKDGTNKSNSHHNTNLATIQNYCRNGNNGDFDFVDDPKDDINNDWTPYLEMLPTIINTNTNTNTNNGVNVNVHDVASWSIEQIHRLEVPSIIQRAIQKKRSIEELLSASSASTTMTMTTVPVVHNKDIVQNSTTTIDELQFATWLINSRAITIIEEENENEHETNNNDDDDDDDDDDSQRNYTCTCVLIPLLDMINHSSNNPNAYFSVLGSNNKDDDVDGNNDDKKNNDQENTEDDDDILYYAAIADRDIQSGEEILISYGQEEESTVDLLLQYGFVPDEENPYDVDFWRMTRQQQQHQYQQDQKQNGDEDDDDGDDDNDNDKKDKIITKATTVANTMDANSSSTFDFDWSSTTLKEDEGQLTELLLSLCTGQSQKSKEEVEVQTEQQQVKESSLLHSSSSSSLTNLMIERCILEFRIRLKRSYYEYHLEKNQIL